MGGLGKKIVFIICDDEHIRRPIVHNRVDDNRRGSEAVLAFNVGKDMDDTLRSMDRTDFSQEPTMQKRLFELR